MSGFASFEFPECPVLCMMFGVASFVRHVRFYVRGVGLVSVDVLEYPILYSRFGLPRLMYRNICLQTCLWSIHTAQAIVVV